MMLGDTEHAETARELDGALGSQLVRRPPLGIGCAEFPAGRRHAHDAGPEVPGNRHEAARAVRLVIRVGPDSEDRS